MRSYKSSKEMRLFLPFKRKGLLQFERTQLAGGEHLSSYGKTSLFITKYQESSKKEQMGKTSKKPRYH